MHVYTNRIELKAPGTPAVGETDDDWLDILRRSAEIRS